MQLATEKMKETIFFLQTKGIKKVACGLVLGSGLGDLAEEIQHKIEIPYQDIPHFPATTVVGHSGKLIFGVLSGKTILVLQGRFHFYEGNLMSQVIYPVQIMKALGVQSLIVTNASGGVNRNFAVGDLMVITDHINFMGANPLIGENQAEIGPRFPDMCQAYCRDYIEKAHLASRNLNISLKDGIYMAFSGPSYETPAEIQMARRLGADAVGMSTIPEVIAANHAGIKVLGISCITNLAAGLQSNLNHEEVVKTTQQTKIGFGMLIKEVLYDL